MASSPLEIEFLDGPPAMELGSRTRIRVLQRDAEGQPHPIEIDGVSFSFTPLVWAEVRPGSHPAVGLLEVVELAADPDVLEAPHYGIAASLNQVTGQTIHEQRELAAELGGVEVELSFSVGTARRRERFALTDLIQPVDWARVQFPDPARQRIYVRDGRAFLRLEPPLELPLTVTIPFPNGKEVQFTLDGALQLTPLRGGQPAELVEQAGEGGAGGAGAAGGADPEAVAALREELRGLASYVASYRAALAQAGPARARAQERIEAEVERVFERWQAASPTARARLESLLERALEVPCAAEAFEQLRQRALEPAP